MTDTPPLRATCPVHGTEKMLPYIRFCLECAILRAMAIGEQQQAARQERRRQREQQAEGA